MAPKIPRKSREEKLHKFTAQERTELDRIEANALADFEGQLEELESALGMLRMGHHMGWKVLYLIHSKKTIRKYESILTGDSKDPVLIRNIFPEVGPSSYRSLGFRIVDGFSNFWKAIGGDAKLEIEDKRTLLR